MNCAVCHEALTGAQTFAYEKAALRILLGTDNRQLRSLLVMILRRDGYEVIEAKDGAEMLEALSSNLLEQAKGNFDLVISEAKLPGISGLAILAGLRAWGQSTPFVLITGSPDVQRRGRDQGAVILEHPINIRGIRGALYQSFSVATSAPSIERTTTT